MIDNRSIVGIGEWLLGGAFALLALTAGAISLMMNVTFGLQVSWLAALVFVLSDGAKILLPMIAAVLGWDIRRRIAWGLAVAISVTAALSSLLEGQAQRLKDTQAAALTANGARADMERARKELSMIAEPTSVDALRVLTQEAQDKADREAARGGCGAKCEAAREIAVKLVTRLGLAEQRDKLQAQLAMAKETAEATPITALGATDTLAALTGGDQAQIAMITGIAISVVMLAILELLATFSGDGVLILRKAWMNRRNEHSTQNMTIAKQQASPSTKSEKTVANRAYYLNRLKRDFPALAARVHEGELSVYRACVEAGLRKAPARNWGKLEAYAFGSSATPLPQNFDPAIPR